MSPATFWLAARTLPSASGLAGAAVGADTVAAEGTLVAAGAGWAAGGLAGAQAPASRSSAPRTAGGRARRDRIVTLRKGVGSELIPTARRTHYGELACT